MTAESQELKLAKQQLRAQRRELRSLAERIGELEQELEDERRAFEAAEVRADRYIDQLRAIRASTSWRVTRPLRAAGGRRGKSDADA